MSIVVECVFRSTDRSAREFYDLAKEDPEAPTRPMFRSLLDITNPLDIVADVQQVVHRTRFLDNRPKGSLPHPPSLSLSLSLSPTLPLVGRLRLPTCSVLLVCVYVCIHVFVCV
jgi:hypothetical protein